MNICTQGKRRVSLRAFLCGSAVGGCRRRLQLEIPGGMFRLQDELPFPQNGWDASSHARRTPASELWPPLLRLPVGKWGHWPQGPLCPLAGKRGTVSGTPSGGRTLPGGSGSSAKAGVLHICLPLYRHRDPLAWHSQRISSPLSLTSQLMTQIA